MNALFFLLVIFIIYYINVSFNKKGSILGKDAFKRGVIKI